MYLKNYSSDYGNQQNFHRLHQLHQCTGPKQDIIQDLQAEDHFEVSATYGSSPSDEIILPTVPNEILYPPTHKGVIQFCENYILQSGIYTNVVVHSKKVASVFSNECGPPSIHLHDIRPLSGRRLPFHGLIHIGESSKVERNVHSQFVQSETICKYQRCPANRLIRHRNGYLEQNENKTT
ncbi:hypothetical protein T06_15260 [Trichinella sp. T6]|nr:hypothetical protein T06_15260 [Trichinella sp. T6]